MSFRKPSKKVIAWSSVSVLVILMALLVQSFTWTNPFAPNSIVEQTYSAELKDGEFVVNDDPLLIQVNQSTPFKQYSKVKSAYHIVANRWWNPGKPAPSDNWRDIMNDIYDARFNSDQQVLISADHFSMFYNRSLGIFYYPMLDPAIDSSDARWQDRQAIYLRSLAYALNTYEHTDHVTTTIVPTGKHRVTPVNFHSYPSDTMYSLLYGLAVTSGKEPAAPFKYAEPKKNLQTKKAGEALLDKHRPMLKRQYETYKQMVHDKSTGLIKPELHLSGTKDITMRSNAFYDNVIFWRTTQLAMELDIIPADQAFLDTTKSKIIDAFWLKDKGYFLEDRSVTGIDDNYFSSDWLVALNTGFLDPSNPDELSYITKPLDYMRQTKVDKPFGVKYQNETRAERQFPVVRLVASSYGGDTIWSYWGMEYVKALLAVYRETGDKKYLDIADEVIAAYKQKIEQYHGFPETYDRNGNMYETNFYRSMRQTGWVIGFDQVLSMREAIK